MSFPLSALRFPLLAVLLLLLLRTLAVADVCVLVRVDAITTINDELATTNTVIEYTYTVRPDERRVAPLVGKMVNSDNLDITVVSNSIARSALMLMGWAGDTDEITVVLP